MTEVQRLIERWRDGEGLLLFLTGAGVSAESGIPTFRGDDGYWRAGSVNDSPMELATAAMFATQPETVWCLGISPGFAARRARSRTTRTMPATTCAIHGSGFLTRCSQACTDATSPLPPLDDAMASDALSGVMLARLTCKRCGSWMRPHVLWFDERYDELHYKSETAMRMALRATLLVTAGTTGATTLPFAIGRECARSGVPIIDINPEPNPFSELAERNGAWLRGSASSGLTKISLLLGMETTK